MIEVLSAKEQLQLINDKLIDQLLNYDFYQQTTCHRTIKKLFKFPYYRYFESNFNKLKPLFGNRNYNIVAEFVRCLIANNKKQYAIEYLLENDRYYHLLDYFYKEPIIRNNQIRSLIVSRFNEIIETEKQSKVEHILILLEIANKYSIDFANTFSLLLPNLNRLRFELNTSYYQYAVSCFINYSIKHNFWDHFKYLINNHIFTSSTIIDTITKAPIKYLEYAILNTNYSYFRVEILTQILETQNVRQMKILIRNSQLDVSIVKSIEFKIKAKNYIFYSKFPEFIELGIRAFEQLDNRKLFSKIQQRLL